MGADEVAWLQCLDESSGHYYYWDASTNEVLWELPEGTKYTVHNSQETAIYHGYADDQAATDSTVSTGAPGQVNETPAALINGPQSMRWSCLLHCVKSLSFL
jgi:hypothetical protein